MTKIPEMSKATVHMKDPEHLEQILESIKPSGPNTLQVISDFDMTLTRFAYNGKRCPTSHNGFGCGILFFTLFSQMQIEVQALLSALCRLIQDFAVRFILDPGVRDGNIREATNYTEDSGRAATITKCLGEMIVKDLQPLSIEEEEGF